MILKKGGVSYTVTIREATKLKEEKTEQMLQVILQERSHSNSEYEKNLQNRGHNGEDAAKQRYFAINRLIRGLGDRGLIPYDYI